MKLRIQSSGSMDEFCHEIKCGFVFGDALRSCLSVWTPKDPGASPPPPLPTTLSSLPWGCCGRSDPRYKERLDKGRTAERDVGLLIIFTPEINLLTIFVFQFNSCSTLPGFWDVWRHDSGMCDWSRNIWCFIDIIRYFLCMIWIKSGLKILQTCSVKLRSLFSGFSLDTYGFHTLRFGIHLGSLWSEFAHSQVLCVCVKGHTQCSQMSESDQGICLSVIPPSQLTPAHPPVMLLGQDLCH